MFPSVMAPGGPNCSEGQVEHVSVTVAPSSKFWALANDAHSIVAQKQINQMIIFPKDKNGRWGGNLLKGIKVLLSQS